MEESLQVTTVIVIPRTHDHARYILNDGSSHVLKYRDLEVFLKKLVPSKSQVIKEFLYTFQHFYVVVPDMTVEKFDFDFDGERKKFREEVRLRQLSPEHTLRLMQSQAKSANDSMDKVFEKLSKKLDRHSYERILGLSSNGKDEIQK